MRAPNDATIPIQNKHDPGNRGNPSGLSRRLLGMGLEPVVKAPQRGRKEIVTTSLLHRLMHLVLIENPRRTARKVDGVLWVGWECPECGYWCPVRIVTMKEGGVPLLRPYL